VEIPLSRIKLLVAFLICGLFTYGGVLMMNDTSGDNRIGIVGLLGCSFFGLAALVILIKFLDRRQGLLISQDGIFENSNGISVGLVDWEDLGLKRRNSG
jgi:hypothetical protein